jgi:hypothetical protein
MVPWPVGPPLNVVHYTTHGHGGPLNGSAGPLRIDRAHRNPTTNAVDAVHR